jgi:hypothetical protein
MEIIVCSFLILFGKSQARNFEDFVDRFVPSALSKGNKIASKLFACFLLLLYSKLGLIFHAFGFLQPTSKKELT